MGFWTQITSITPLFFLWGHINNAVNKSRPQNIDDLEAKNAMKFINVGVFL